MFHNTNFITSIWMSICYISITFLNRHQNRLRVCIQYNREKVQVQALEKYRKSRYVNMNINKYMYIYYVCVCVLCVSVFVCVRACVHPVIFQITNKFASRFKPNFLP
jgi:formate hydrogenlyase subunit 6/NADH:ubiquinone oxidoreductase subunit I